jgi:hypothetical protein
MSAFMNSHQPADRTRSPKGGTSSFHVRKICGDDASPVDVVFVHGLTGNQVRTWDQPRSTWELLTRRFRIRDESADIWPAKLQRARVWLAGYPAPLLEVFHRGKAQRALQEEGDEAQAVLQRQIPGDKPIIFVAHSLGGLLVKALLCSSSRRRADAKREGCHPIIEKTAGVMFLATPHAGSDRVRIHRWIPALVRVVIAGLWAAVGMLVEPSWFSAPIMLIGSKAFTFHDLVFEVLPVLMGLAAIRLLLPSRHVKLLDPASPELRVLQKEFRQLLRDRPEDALPIAIKAMYESRPTRHWGISLGILVSWSSADPGVQDCTPEEIPANHVDICKRWAVENCGIRDELQRLIDHATSGKTTSVLRRPLTALLKTGDNLNENTPMNESTRQLLLALIEAGQFEGIPAENGRRQEAEQLMRIWLRYMIQREFLRLAEWELKMAAHSPFDLDRYVRAIWWQSQLTRVPGILTAHALNEKQHWPGANGKWPTLISFYRSLRTIEHVRNFENEKLPELLFNAYTQLNDAQKQPDTRPDKTGVTRWLLFRMECVARLAGAALDFVGKHESKGPEPPDVTAAREKMREHFSMAYERLVSSLAAAKQTSPRQDSGRQSLRVVVRDSTP